MRLSIYLKRNVEFHTLISEKQEVNQNIHEVIPVKEGPRFPLHEIAFHGAELIPDLPSKHLT
jgi:hypothetical protein